LEHHVKQPLVEYAFGNSIVMRNSNKLNFNANVVTHDMQVLWLRSAAIVV